MKKWVVTLFMVVLSMNSFSQTTWKSDPDHSKLGFTIKHLGLSDVKGFFTNFDIDIVAAKTDLSDASVKLEANTNSINTLVAKRDIDLKSADFFDVENFPKLKFVSKSIEKTQTPNVYKLTGDLTIHGITKSVVLDFDFNGIAKNPAANNTEVAGVQVKGELDRRDFHIGNKYPSLLISDKVIIKADIELIK